MRIGSPNSIAGGALLRLTPLSLLVALLIVVSASLSSGAQAKSEMLTDTVVYHEPTDTYFELVNRLEQYPESRNSQWPMVKEWAERRMYKDRRGRLAVVDTREKNNFLRDTFKPSRAAWIGLRYFCENNGLMWVNGKRLDRAKFQNWGVVWNVEGGKANNVNRVTSCTQIPYRGVHYWPVDAGFRWNANGSGKSFDFFFVEYPPKDKYWE